LASADSVSSITNSGFSGLRVAKPKSPIRILPSESRNIFPGFFGGEESQSIRSIS
jgi:hypothetical protein